MDALEDTGGEEQGAQGSSGQEWAPTGRLHGGGEARKKAVGFPLSRSSVLSLVVVHSLG